MPKFSNISPADHTIALQNLERAQGSVGQLFAAQTAFSRAMFGDCNFRGPAAVLDHVRKEVEEIAREPSNPTEWADLAILALDGLQRANWLTNNAALSEKPPTAAKDVLIGKMRANFQRDWPALSEQDPTLAVEHVRSDSERAEKEIELAQAPIGTPHPCTRPETIVLRDAFPDLLESPTSNNVPDLREWGDRIREYAKLMGYPSLQHLLNTAGLGDAVANIAPTYLQCLDVVAATHKVSASVVQEYMVEAMRNTLPAYRAGMAQRIAVESVIRKAGYNDLLTFVLTALAELGHVVPEATDEGGDE